MAQHRSAGRIVHGFGLIQIVAQLTPLGSAGGDGASVESRRAQPADVILRQLQDVRLGARAGQEEREVVEPLAGTEHAGALSECDRPPVRFTAERGPWHMSPGRGIAGGAGGPVGDRDVEGFDRARVTSGHEHLERETRKLADERIEKLHRSLVGPIDVIHHDRVVGAARYRSHQRHGGVSNRRRSAIHNGVTYSREHRSPVPERRRVGARPGRPPPHPAAGFLYLALDQVQLGCLSRSRPPDHRPHLSGRRSTTARDAG